MEEKNKKCKIEGCTKKYRAKGYCEYHYKKWRNGEYGKVRYKTCTGENCRAKRTHGSLCETHYNEKMKKK